MVRPNRAGSRIVSPSLAYIASRNSYMRATFHFGATNALHGPTGEHLLSTQNNAITLPPRKGATCSRCLLEAVMTVSNKLLCQTCAAEMKTATGRSLRACVQCGDGTKFVRRREAHLQSMRPTHAGRQAFAANVG